MLALLSALVTWAGLVVASFWLAGSLVIAWCIIGARLYRGELVASVATTLFWPLLMLFDAVLAIVEPLRERWRGTRGR